MAVLSFSFFSLLSSPCPSPSPPFEFCRRRVRVKGARAASTPRLHSPHRIYPPHYDTFFHTSCVFDWIGRTPSYRAIYHKRIKPHHTIPYHAIHPPPPSWTCTCTCTLTRYIRPSGRLRIRILIHIYVCLQSLLYQETIALPLTRDAVLGLAR